MNGGGFLLRVMFHNSATYRSCTVKEKSANGFSRESKQVKRTLCREITEKSSHAFALLCRNQRQGSCLCSVASAQVFHQDLDKHLEKASKRYCLSSHGHISLHHLVLLENCGSWMQLYKLIKCTGSKTTTVKIRQLKRGGFLD